MNRVDEALLSINEHLVYIMNETKSIYQALIRIESRIEALENEKR